MVLTDPDDLRAAYLTAHEAMNAAADEHVAYRRHLATCPHRHFGILATCGEAARLRRVWTGDDGDFEPAPPGAEVSADA
ncbi:hypothetical protein [Streptomyces sp. G45]|uniref:hypothetical protein n=1 Tax=Streptomyces sp. G45 TaxID=3406627 RepID=UPI003C19F2F2